MMFDEASMEGSQSSVKALQELENLRPQLYSAAEFCEKSYQCSKQKQKVIDNLKDYAVRAVVNAVDHLGTVAYKLNEIIEQQTLDVLTMELKVRCLDQQLRTCQTYTDKEGLRQQQLLGIVPRHHKHYTLPAPVLCRVNKNVHSGSQESRIQRSPRKHTQTKRRFFLSGASAAKTLTWHLASEAKSKLKRASTTFISDENVKSSGALDKTIDVKQSINSETSSARPRSLRGAGPASSAAMQTLGIIRRDAPEVYKPMTPNRSFGKAQRKKTMRLSTRSKTAFSALFVKKKKTRELKTSRVQEEDS